MLSMKIKALKSKIKIEKIKDKREIMSMIILKDAYIITMNKSRQVYEKQV